MPYLLSNLALVSHTFEINMGAGKRYTLEEQRVYRLGRRLRGQPTEMEMSHVKESSIVSLQAAFSMRGKTSITNRDCREQLQKPHLEGTRQFNKILLWSFGNGWAAKINITVAIPLNAASDVRSFSPMTKKLYVVALILKKNSLVLLPKPPFLWMSGGGRCNFIAGDVNRSSRVISAAVTMISAGHNNPKATSDQKQEYHDSGRVSESERRGRLTNTDLFVTVLEE